MTSDVPTVNEHELVQRAMQRDAAAFEELVRLYYPKIRQLTYRMTRNADDSAEVTQDIFVKAYAGLPHFKGGSSFYTWLYRIAVNHTLNFLKKRQLRTAPSMDDTEQNVEQRKEYVERAGVRTPDREAHVAELQNRLNAALGKLSDKHRTVVVLHDIEGVPHEEIARMMRCSPGTVRSRLFYARKQLQKELAEFAP